MSTLVIKPRARLFHGHEWVYATEVQRVLGDPQPGAVVQLQNVKNRPLGSAIYNPHSQIVARRFSRRKQDLDADFFQRRIERALTLREAMGFSEPVYRLVWSEADGLPGLVIDRYGPHFVLQTLTMAMDQRKKLIVKGLNAVFQPKSIIERNDSPIRKAEGLEAVTGVLHGASPGPLEIEVLGVRQTVDLLEGQKTGIYLDQIDNYAAVAALAKGARVLDCFCNQGGFALHCARAGAASVTAVDSSESAIATARVNAAANGLTIDFVAANAFDLLKKAESALSPGEEGPYDLIVLDPPSFTRNRKSLNDALRGYKEIHLRALKLLARDGILATFCCSHHVSRGEFLQVLCDASVDAKQTVRLLATHGQRRDHPVIPTLPETEYLKGHTVQAMAGW
ncbi:MAG: class I SAM-dependent rRNA methyltransferase [Verrucomicrobiae bacterium]|nr:class I SAM-dependent rRNA methyltransferase [Verrucomicrobiae bacterium]MCP5539668.1 class I SAM-dependent rRNA methyltransferase [Akkermansiaceae bacterium]